MQLFNLTSVTKQRKVLAEARKGMNWLKQVGKIEHDGLKTRLALCGNTHQA